MNLRDSVCCLGSCFSDHMGRKLSENKFRTEVNPLGIVYNPYSIFKNIRSVLSEAMDPDDCVRMGSIHYHWDAHSSIAHTDPEGLKQLITAKAALSRASLLQANWMLLTFGTAHVYQYRPTARIVANCHKVPQSAFDKRLLSVQEITEAYFETLQVLKSLNPQLKVILTVSPVRHIRDGLTENSLSKAILIQAVREIVRQDDKAHYFPAYEVMMDELRDYRFYKEDMIHPSDQAVEYIWEKLVATFMDEASQRFIGEWKKIQKSLEHRPFHPDSADHQRFLKATLEKLQRLENQADVSSEQEILRKQLI